MSQRLQIPLGQTAGGASTLALLDGPSHGAAPLLVLAHGAGTSAAHPTLGSLAQAFVEKGFRVLRFDFPYRRPDPEHPEGPLPRRPPDRMPKIVACFGDVVLKAQSFLQPERLLVGGHSMGSRAAAHLAVGDSADPRHESLSVDGVLLCAFPLHPARKPERLRDKVLLDLDQVGLPTLWISGTRDNLCWEDPYQRLRQSLGKSFSFERIAGADHGYDCPKKSGQSRSDVLNLIATRARNWSEAQSRRHKA